jgi:hypothetical protein
MGTTTATLQFKVKSNSINQPSAPYHRESSGGWIGSQAILRLLLDGRDRRLAVYKLEPPRNMPEAIATATKYIRAYSDPEAREIDPKACAAVGNRIHIATITPTDGFRWVPGFEPPGPDRQT